MKIVLYDAEQSSTYTQMSCSTDVPAVLVFTGAFLFTVPFGLAMLLFRGVEKFFSLITIGFNFTIVSADIMAVTDAFFAPIIMTAVGAVLLIIGESLLMDKLLLIGDGYSIINRVK